MTNWVIYPGDVLLNSAHRLTQEAHLLKEWIEAGSCLPDPELAQISSLAADLERDLRCIQSCLNQFTHELTITERELLQKVEQITSLSNSRLF